MLWTALRHEPRVSAGVFHRQRPG